MLFADIILPVYLVRNLTYSVPEEMEDTVSEGMLVSVPLGPRKVYTGVVKCLHHEKPEHSPRALLGPADSGQKIDRRQLAFWEWMSSYYLCTEGEIFKAAMPALLKPARMEPGGEPAEPVKQKRRRKTVPEPTELLPLDRVVLPALSAAQQQAESEIRTGWASKQVVLLHGVTSSGKTEIYFRFIRETLEQGRQVLYLLPEIALTAQMIDRLKKVFGNRVAVYHSRHTDRQRADVWRSLSDASENGPDIILGVRSSVFLPFKRLGLVIVDEEHENSYKQTDPPPRYHARDAAIVLASLHDARVLLGSATPSFESYYNARKGKYALVRLTERYGGAQLPVCTVADMRGCRGLFHPVLAAKMRDALSRGRQVMLFQNLRGFAPYMQCDVCGGIVRCGNCDVSLTYHRALHALVCHYCGAVVPETQICPACRAPALRSVGYGTERIEAEVLRLFPEAHTARLDLDATRRKGDYERVLSDFSSRETDVLIGTQMIAKGLDFSHVHLIGVLQADRLLNIPDFRAYERGFQLMEQVSGRAGRRDEAGEVVIQTSDVYHPLLQFVSSHDYEGVFRMQMRERYQFVYPPFCRMIRFTLRHRNETLTAQAAAVFAEQLRSMASCPVLGPQAAAVPRVRQNCLQQLVLKIPRDMPLPDVKRGIVERMRALNAMPAYRQVVILADVDPQ
ncbi:MAG: primosomal protein N' [Bacteroidales bacterium]|nr:primosomal protein N' [Bacteroidales bacterium]